MSIMEPLFWDSPVALPIPDKPLTSDMVVECIDNVEPDATLLPPVILEEISQSAEHMKALAKLNVVAFGGGESSMANRRSVPELCTHALQEILQSRPVTRS